MISGHICEGSGSMKDPRPYEACIYTDRDKGWLRVLDGELPDHTVQFTTFDKLPAKSPFILMGIRYDMLGGLRIFRKQGSDAMDVKNEEVLQGIDPDAKVIQVSI